MTSAIAPPAGERSALLERSLLPHACSSFGLDAVWPRAPDGLTQELGSLVQLHPRTMERWEPAMLARNAGFGLAQGPEFAPSKLGEAVEHGEVTASAAQKRRAAQAAEARAR